MGKPIDLKQLLRRLEKELDDALWEGSDPDKIKNLRKRIDMVKLKLDLGQTHDANF
jgi:hypothetical protein